MAISRGIKKTILILVVIALIVGIVKYSRWQWPAKLDIVTAVDRGFATIEAEGIDVEKMKITLTSTRNMEIQLPVGALFLSQSGGTQNMMAAKTVSFVFTNAHRDSPQSITQEIEVYCINRFQDAPTEESLFQVSRTEETNPIQKLAACLDSHNADHESRQIAVWMISDNFINMTFDEVVEKMTEYIISHEDPSSVDRLLDEIKKKYPELSEDQIREIINSPDMRDEAQQIVREETTKEVKEYASKSGPLLEACGYQLKDSRFFQR